MLTRLLSILFLLVLIGYCSEGLAQKPVRAIEASLKKKPFKILTMGRTITIKSTVSIKNLMIWTSRGNRVLEQKGINQTQYSYSATIRENIFFLLIELDNGERFTERIGI